MRRKSVRARILTVEILEARQLLAGDFAADSESAIAEFGYFRNGVSSIGNASGP